MRRNVPIRRERETRALLTSLVPTRRPKGDEIELVYDDYLDLNSRALTDGSPVRKPLRNQLSPKEKKQIKRRDKKLRSMSRRGMEGSSNA